MAMEEIAQAKIALHLARVGAGPVPPGRASSFLSRSPLGPSLRAHYVGGAHRSRHHRRHRGLQGMRDHPPARGGGPRRAAAADARCRALRRAETFYALARTDRRRADPYPHLQRADLLVVAPLTAHTMARLAHGLADDVLTEAVLAHDGPVLVAPAMNTRMWEHPATQANLALLRERGRRDRRPGERRARRGRGRRRADGRAGRDRRPGRSAPAARSRIARGRSTSSSRPAAPASRSTPSASSATARPAGWGSRSPTRRTSAARA